MPGKVGKQTATIRPVRTDWTLPALLADRAARDPDRTLLRFGDESYSASSLDRESEAVARRLAGLGMSAGDTCAVMMDGSPAYIATWFGIAKAGAVEVPLNTAYKGEMLAQVLARSGVRAIICDPGYLDVLEPAVESCGGLEFVLAAAAREEIPAAVGSVERLPLFDETPDGVHVELPEVCYSDPACIMFTSGTTGESKGVLISQHHQISFGETFSDIVELRAEDVTYGFLPFFHIGGKFIVLSALLKGATVVLRERFSVSDFWDDVHRFGATVAVGVGGVCNMLLGRPKTEDDANNTLRIIYAVPVPHELKAEFESRFDLTLVEGYGSTETNVVAFTPPTGAPWGACGLPNPRYEIKIFDEHDQEVATGEAGEIVIRPRGPHLLMQGYLGMPEETLNVFRNFWFHSGDRGRMDENGWLYFVDRVKDSIRRRGENISSYEVEGIVKNHPDVVEAAAVGVPSDVGEDEILLVAVTRAGRDLSAESLLEYCARELPYFMVPRYIEFREKLPRTPTEKIAKHELRRQGLTSASWDSLEAGFKVTRDGLTRLAHR